MKTIQELQIAIENLDKIKESKFKQVIVENNKIICNTEFGKFVWNGVWKNA